MSNRKSAVLSISAGIIVIMLIISTMTPINDKGYVVSKDFKPAHTSSMTTPRCISSDGVYATLTETTTINYPDQYVLGISPGAGTNDIHRIVVSKATYDNAEIGDSFNVTSSFSNYKE